MSFVGWQLNIVLDFFVSALSLSPPAWPRGSHDPLLLQLQLPPPPPPLLVPSGGDERECVRALAQLLYENGERLGTRFVDVLPPLLGLADPSAVDLETR